MSKEAKRIKKEKNLKLLSYYENKQLDKIVELMNPFVQMIAYKMYYASHKMIEMDDLISNGYIGLLDAISKFDSKKSKNLKSYAEIRIKGAMLDYIRSQDKLPRSMRDKVTLIQNTLTNLESKLGRKATDMEIAQELHFESVEDYYSYLNTIKKAFYINLNDFYPNSEKSLEIKDDKILNPEKKYQMKQRNKYLRNKISQLKPKQRKVIELHYLKEMNLKEISKEMNLTESRISQLHLAALKILKEELNQDLLPM